MESVHNIRKLIDGVQPLPEGDASITHIITMADPEDVESATRNEIDSFASRQERMDRHLDSAEYLREIARERGEELADKYSQTADSIQEIIDGYYTKYGIKPSEDLLDDLLKYSEKANFPPEILGMSETLYLSWIGIDESSAEELQIELDLRRDDYELAQRVRGKRNKLGRREKIGTWIGGTIISFGLGAGAAELMTNSQEVAGSTFSKALVYVGSYSTVPILGLMTTGYLANKARNVSARKRAKRLQKEGQTS